MQKNSLILGLLTIVATIYTQTEALQITQKHNLVHFDNATFVVVENDVTIGAETRVSCGVHLLGNTSIGKNCTIGHYSILKNCTIGDNVIIESHCVLENTIIESAAQIGPFAHISESSKIGKKAIIGNFVEVKRSTIGQNTKAKHLAYLGDVTLGQNVNIGAGTIFCNYNGVAKQPTTVGDHAFIGSNTTIVAPLYIGNHAMTGAGSVITKNIPDNCLAIARTQSQVNKLDYTNKLLNKYKQGLVQKNPTS